MMMQGIDETFAGAIFIGYHTGTTNSQGVRAHTISSARLADVQLKGVSVSEAGLNAAIAGHFNVPVIMISGDDAVVKETQALLGDVEGAVVKWASGFHSARTIMPEASYQLIREKVKKAVGRIKDFKPYKLAGANSTRRALQELPSVRSVELLEHRRTHRCTQHSIHGQRHDRGVEVSRVYRDLRTRIGAVTTGRIFAVDLLRIDRQSRVDPRIESAVERMHIFPTTIGELLRHTGARSFVWSSAVG